MCLKIIHLYYWNNTIEENEKMINIVENVPLIKQLEQQGSGLKILIPN